MADEQNGKAEKKGLTALLEDVQADVKVLREKAKEDLESLKKPARLSSISRSSELSTMRANAAAP